MNYLIPLQAPSKYMERVQLFYLQFSPVFAIFLRSAGAILGYAWCRGDVLFLNCIDANPDSSQTVFEFSNSAI